MPRRRSASGSSASSATRTSPTAARRSTASCGAWRGPRSSSIGPERWRRWPAVYRMADAGRLLCRHRLRRRQRPAGGHAAGGRRRHRERCCRRSRRRPGAHRRHPRQGRRRPAHPLRQVLPPHPRRPHRGLHHPRPGRHRPPGDLPDRGQRAGRATGSSTWSGRRRPSRPIPSPSASRPTTGPGCCPTSATSWPSTRSTSWPPTWHEPGPHGHRPGHAPGVLGGAAGAGAVPPRAAQGRLLGPARPGLISPRRPAARRPRRRLSRYASPPARQARHEART